jgi:quercetin dioxygenase-like cupin family protein
MDHFISLNALALQELIKGGFAGFVNTANLTLAYTELKAGAEVPLHHHHEEAVDVVVDGELEMQIGDSKGILKHGMISLVPSNMPHKAKAISDSKVVTIFYPRREL